MRISHFLLITTCWIVGNTVLSQTVIDKGHILVNDSITIDLPEVFIKAERPLVKIVDGKLQYDIPNLVKQKPVNNAFDVLSELPGVEKNGDRVSLIGALETNLIIDGKRSTMTMEQLTEMLKSMPNSKVKTIEVMYATPPQYGVKGASINIVLTKDKAMSDIIKSELSFSARQSYYLSPSGAFNFSYTGKKIVIDFSYSTEYKHSRGTEDMLAEPTVSGVKYLVDQHNWSESKNMINHVRGSLEWDLRNNGKLFFSYSGRYFQGNPLSVRNGETRFNDRQVVTTENRSKAPSQLHNARMDYSLMNLNVGLDYTYYNQCRLVKEIRYFSEK